MAYDVSAAIKFLDEAKWILADDGIRYKDGKALRVQLVAPNSDDYPVIAQALKEQWLKIGVDLDVLIVSESDIQQNHIANHNYEILLFGIALGNDPDVFVYWHSSQSGVNGFNLSQFTNDIADEALESGRTRNGDKLRAAKYKTFLTEWRQDAPATALYRPGFSYVQRSGIAGFETFRVTSPDDRFTNIHEWQINTKTGDKEF